MDFRLDFLGGENAADTPFFVNEEGGAEYAHVGAAVHFLFSPCTEGFEQLVLGVGNEVEGEAVAFTEVLVRPCAVRAHADDFVAGLSELVVMVAEAARLGGTAGGVVLGIEIEHYLASTKCAETQFIACFVVAQQVGGLFAYGHNQCMIYNF